MKNITLKIDDETYRRARIRAAEAGTSVSAMVRDFLQREDSEIEARENRRIAALRELYDMAGNKRHNGATPVIPLSRNEIYEDQ